MGVHSSTVFRSIKETFKDIGVDIDVFKGHSTRSTSTSKACLSGISVDDMLLAEVHGQMNLPGKNYIINKCFQEAIFSGRGTRVVW